MATGVRQCLYCGKQLTKQQVWRNCKYCSRKCFANGYWGKPIRGSKGTSRNPLFTEALKLRKTGMTQREISDLIGMHPSTLSDWFVRYGNENIPIERVCLHCGKKYDGKKRRSKYCSEKCESKAAYLRKHPVLSRMKFDPELRAKALEMYRGGLEGTFIAQYLNVAEGTVHSWIHDFGHLKKRKRNPEMMALLPVNLRIESAQSPKEFRRILRENAPDGNADPVIVVCAPHNGNGGMNGLVSIIYDRLKRNPCDGVTYAFCSSVGEQVSTICWRKDTFHLTKIPKSRGEYIWPDSSVGLSIELRKNEFDYLLTLSKKRGAKPYFT